MRTRKRNIVELDESDHELEVRVGDLSIEVYCSGGSPDNPPCVSIRRRGDTRWMYTELVRSKANAEDKVEPTRGVVNVFVRPDN